VGNDGPQVAGDNVAEDNVAGDKAAYDLAYELLKQGRMDDALAGFESFTRDFPDSGLLPNAVYWMGEIHLVQNDQQAAIERFSRVVETYPAHQKAADAHYKLGTLYLQLGDKAQARMHLERAALAGGSVAVLAKRYLETHF
jgi:tol-pal system protein YbgF